MKFSVSYGRKVKAGKPYEMMEVHASAESDTSIETMENAYERIREFVDTKIESNCNRLHKQEVTP